MERIQRLFRPRPAYEPLDDGSGHENGRQRGDKGRFAWLEYSIFLLLGVSMLWAW